MGKSVAGTRDGCGEVEGVMLDTSKQPESKHPVENANWLSFATFSWMSTLMNIAYKHGLNESNIPSIPTKEGCKRNTDLLEQLWAREVSFADVSSKSRPSFTRVAWLYCRTRIFFTSLIYLTSLVLGFITPTILMKKVISLTTAPTVDKYDALMWVSLLVLCELGRVFFITLTWAMSYRTAFRLKAASMGLVYRKLLRIGNLSDQVSTKLLNVISGDCGRIYEVIVSGQVAIGGPFVLIMCSIYIWYELGWLPLLGLAVFPLAYPLQYFLAKGSGSMKRKAVRVKDERISLTSQAIQHFKFLKMFAWENYLFNTITDARERERKYLVKSQLFQSFSTVLGPTLPHIAAISTFLLYITTGQNLLPAQAFCITAAFTSRVRPTVMRMRSGFRAWFDAKIAVSRIQAFTILFLFSLLYFSIRMLTLIYECWYSFRICSERMKSLLVLPEIQDAFRNEYNIKCAASDEAILLEDLTLFRRGPHDSRGSVHKSEKQRKNETKNINSIERLLGSSEIDSDSTSFQLGPIDLHIKKGAFVGICGYVGSGKTTLLETMAGSLTTENGTLNICGKIAYTPQHPWLFKGTIRDNIIFGENFDSVRYYNCVESCCLINDFGILPLGDLTTVENGGMNMSGGQRQRISLARALYSQSSDIFLLDDPLSGLDNRVAKTVFENVILNKLRKQKKTILLVTHLLNHLKECDEILVISDGKISERGTHEELVVKTDSTYNSLWGSVPQNSSEDENVMLEDSDILDLQMDAGSVTNAKKVQLELEKSRKDVSPQVYLMYLKSAGGWISLVIVLVAFSFTIGSTAFSSWWLKNWFGARDTPHMKEVFDITQSPNLTNSSNFNSVENVDSENVISEYINYDSPHYNFNRNVYAATIGAIIFASLARTIFFVLTTTKASKILHMKMLKQFFSCRIKTLERIGTGQLLNLFSRDIDEIDGSLPQAIESFLQNIFIILSILFLVSLVFPVFLIFTVLMFLVFSFYRKIYNAAIRDLKRIETRRRTPIFSQISETIKGLGTIRAFNKERLMSDEFEKLVDSSSSVSYTFSSSVRWLSIRLDALAVTVTGAVSILVVLFHGTITAAAAGIALAYAAQLSGVFQFTVRLASETEAKFISVERMKTFLSYEQREHVAVGGKENHNDQSVSDSNLKIASSIHPNWPTVGHVKFDSVTLCYSLNDPPVLHEVSFEVQAGQNVGIIGRTGSGKSSIGNALFRLTELKSGGIFIDGVDISEVPLHKLRNSMCVIPQEPCVFQKSVRYNLDPGREFQDRELWAVLEKTGLKPSVENLDSEVGLSHGQKQLLCIARALLRQSKILFVDEATSNMDMETAAIVEKLLAEEFQYSTIFIVAHRTSALKSCETLLILEDGDVRDFGPVGVLSRKPEFKRNFETFESVVL